MSIGKMRERLLVQYNSAGTNTHGSKTPGVWTTLDTVFAESIALSSDERLEASRVGSQVLYRFRIRARSDVTAKMRALWTPSFPSSAPRRVIEFHGIYPDPRNMGYLFIDCGTHDAAPIPDVAVPAPEWVQSGWVS